MSDNTKKNPKHTKKNNKSDSLVSKTDANVDIYGQCMMPADAESAGPGTGDPCDDGRAAE